MGRTWILQTETKGTGANMVPLERATKRSGSVEPVFVRRGATRRPAPGPAPRKPPHEFKVVDVMTRQTILSGADTRATVEALKDVRSLVDVTVYVRRGEDDRWRRLSFGEQRELRELAPGVAPADAPPAR